MGKTVVVLIAVGLGGLFYYQKHQSASPDQPEKPVASLRVAEPAKAQPQTPAQPSEHNWMKRSLDRATEVRNQSRDRLKASQDP